MEATTKTIWKIDPAHTEIHFKVKHMMVSTVTGLFSSFDGQLETETDGFEGAQVQFNAAIDSINTNNQQRDEHLKSADFFDAAQFPQLTFTSTEFIQKNEEDYVLKGDLTIRDVTLPIELDVVFHGTVVDLYQQTKAGFELSGSLSRKAYGLTWNALTEAGNVVVGDKIRLVMNVQLLKA